MPKTYTYEFDCTPEHLFPYLTEDEKMVEWLPNVTRMEPITEGPVGVGEKSKVWIKQGKKEHEHISEVTAYEPNRRIQIDLTGGCFKGKTTMSPNYVLSERGEDGTTLAYTCQVKTDSMSTKIICAMFQPFMKGYVNKMMKTLKEQAEASPAPA